MSCENDFLANFKLQFSRVYRALKYFVEKRHYLVLKNEFKILGKGDMSNVPQRKIVEVIWTEKVNTFIGNLPGRKKMHILFPRFEKVHL